MKTLVHYKKQRVEEFIAKLSLLNELYIERSFSFDTELSKFLQELIEFFEQLGESLTVSKLSQLNIYVETAQKGINPQTLEKLRIGKRENVWIASYHLLDEVSTLLQNSIMEVEVKISEARVLVEQVIISAIQLKLIGDDELKKLHTQKEISELWSSLSQNEQVKLIERKLKLSITREDIIILCDKVCSQIES